MSNPANPVGVVVVTHGRLAEELVSAAKVIVGAPAEHLRHLSLGWNDPLDEAREQVKQAIVAADKGRGVVVLSDMFGGTPTNLCLSFLSRDKVEIVTGVNLPMVVKLASTRRDGLDLPATAQLLTGYGQKNITLASELLRSRASAKTR